MSIGSVVPAGGCASVHMPAYPGSLAVAPAGAVGCRQCETRVHECTCPYEHAGACPFGHVLKKEKGMSNGEE